MFTKKQSFSLLAVGCLLLILVLTACGDNTSTPAATTAATTTAATTAAVTTAATTTTTTKSGTRYQIALVVGSLSDNFYTSMQCGAQEAAKELGDVDLTIQGGQAWDATVQIPIVNALTAKKVQAMAVVVNDSKALYQPLKAANDTGIKILGVDTKLDDTSFEVTNISSDNHALGVEAAKTLAKLMGEKGTALTSAPQPGASTVIDRIQGFVDEMKANHPNIQIVYLGADSGGSLDKVIAAINAAYVAHPDLSGIFPVANTISQAAGAFAKSLPEDKQKSINIVGFDAGPSAVAALQSGQIQVLVAQKPAEMGALAVQNARKALKGEPVEKVIPTGAVSLTKDNLFDPNFAKYVYKAAC